VTSAVAADDVVPGDVVRHIAGVFEPCLVRAVDRPWLILAINTQWSDRIDVTALIGDRVRQWSGPPWCLRVAIECPRPPA
jgi:hypothetical protein